MRKEILPTLCYASWFLQLHCVAPRPPGTLTFESFVNSLHTFILANPLYILKTSIKAVYSSCPGMSISLDASVFYNNRYPLIMQAFL